MAVQGTVVWSEQVGITQVWSLRFRNLQDESELSTDALNLAEPPKDLDRKRIDDFSITVDLACRVFVVEGDAVQRFVQMTNWDYYESLLRFQKVLELSGTLSLLLPPPSRSSRFPSPTDIPYWPYAFLQAVSRAEK